MLKYATLFSGGGLFEAGVGDKAKLVFGVESDTNVASAWHKNHKRLLLEQDICSLDPDSLPQVDYIHASPPCQSFSWANRTREEKPRDVELAIAVCRVIKAVSPDFFSLENVSLYKSSRSLNLIKKTLGEEGYNYDERIINFAHYGVPQFRQRLFFLATKSEPFTLPPENTNTRGWFNAIADLIPTFEQIDPTEKERKAWAEWGRSTMICDRYQVRPKLSYRPCFTIKASLGTDGKGANRKKFIDMYSQKTGFWYSLNTRAIARIMSVPDSFWLPENNALALKILGNGIPSSFVSKLIDHNFT
jgi:DNA (cytosine-5)-methyltransferase 1